MAGSKGLVSEPQADAPAGPGLSPRAETQAWVVLLLLALALRLAGLGDRPFHHDESIHAHASFLLATKGEYKYDPVYHGPVQYFLVAGMFRLLGDSDFTARLPAALGGVLLTAMALLLRRRFSREVALAAGVLVAFSPNLLYYTRFCREDVWSLLGTCGALLYFDRWFLGEPRRLRDLVYSALCLAIAFASKENFYVFLALLAPAVAAVLYEPGRGVVFWPRLRKLIDFLEANTAALLGALCLFVAVSELLYTVLLVHPESGNPVFDAISYWWGQHKVERVAGPKTYHLPRLLLYEFAIVIPALVDLGRRFRRLTEVERFLAVLGISSVAMYAYLGEKTPWLIVHQLWPFLPFAAREWVRLLRKGAGHTMVASWVFGASFVSAIALSFWNSALTPARARAEAVVYVQTSPEILDFVADVRRVAATGIELAGSVDGQAGWPLMWYFRKTQVEWEPPKGTRLPPFVICDDTKADEIANILGLGYSRRTIPLRAWWDPLVTTEPEIRPRPRELLKYVFTREPWSPIGSQDVVVFRREGSAPGPQ